MQARRVAALKRSVQRGAHAVGLEVRRYRGGSAALPYDLDQQVCATIRAVRPYTMTSPAKIAGLCQAVRHVADHGIPGAIVECGVWRGGSMMAAARTLLERGSSERELYLFDTFEGMVEPGAEDRRYDSTDPRDVMASNLRSDHAEMSMWCRASLDDVRSSMSTVGFPAARIHYVAGRTEETLPGEAPERIAILRLDTDWYESTRHELIHLFPRLSPGGVLILDDYGHWLGAQKAVDEYLAEHRLPILLHRLGDGRIGVVPGPIDAEKPAESRDPAPVPTVGET